MNNVCRDDPSVPDICRKKSLQQTILGIKIEATGTIPVLGYLFAHCFARVLDELPHVATHTRIFWHGYFSIEERVF
jgi:hypothetical protein